MELRLKSKDVNAVCEFATTAADNRCTTSLFKTNMHYSHTHSHMHAHNYQQYLGNTYLTRVPCSNAAKTQNPLKVAAVPQTNETISAASGPKFTILSGHVEDVLLFNKFFLIVDTCLSSENIARQSCAMVPKWRFFVSCISSEPRAAHFTPAF